MNDNIPNNNKNMGHKGPNLYKMAWAQLFCQLPEPIQLKVMAAKDSKTEPEKCVSDFIKSVIVLAESQEK
jgi:hypothetical protein